MECCGYHINSTILSYNNGIVRVVMMHNHDSNGLACFKCKHASNVSKIGTCVELQLCCRMIHKTRP